MPDSPLLPDPPAPLPPLDDLSARLQARVESFEAHPDAPRAGRRMQAAPQPELHSADEGVADLNDQLDLLRDQLEVAFDEMEARIRAAELRADEADSRAQVASARAASVLEAVDKLAGELARLAEHSTGDDQRLLRSAVERLRLRLSTG